MALVIDIKVIPSASRSQWAIDAQGNIKCYVVSAPEKGKANKEIITMLAQGLAIPKKEITILTGETGRKKRIKIDHALSYEEFLNRLGLMQQHTFV